MAKIKGLKKVASADTFARGIVVNNHFQNGNEDVFGNMNYGCGLVIPKTDEDSLEDLRGVLRAVGLTVNDYLKTTDDGETYIIWLNSKNSVECIENSLDMANVIIENGDIIIANINISIYEIGGETKTGVYINNALLLQRGMKTARGIFTQNNQKLDRLLAGFDKIENSQGFSENMLENMMVL